MHIKRFVRYAGLACVALLPLIGGEYRGQVKFGDPSLPLPGVTVVATQADKKLSAVTDANGVYDFADLPDGTWQFDVQKEGFTAVKKEVTVGSGLPGPVFDMQMMSLDQIQTVSAAPSAPAAPAAGGSGPPAEETTSNKPAEPATPSLIAANSNANANSKSSGKKNGKIPGPTPGQTSSFQRTDLKGANNAPQQQAANTPPAEVTSEMNQRAADGMLINGSAQNGASSPFAQSPAFGNNRRGGPRLYNYGILVNESNSALNANQYSLNGDATPKLPTNNLTTGFTFGGPVKIPKLVSQRDNVNLFVGYTRQVNRSESISSGLMPTDAMKAGDFSGLTEPDGAPVQVFDPFTNQPFVNNQVPVSRMSPQALALMKLYPEPNFTGNSAYNYQVPIISNTHTDSGNIRVSKAFKRKNFINVNYGMQDIRSDAPNAFNFLDLRRVFGQQATISYRRSFTPRFYGTVTYQFSRQSIQTFPFFSNKENISGIDGITGNDQTPLNWGPPSLSFNQSNISGLTDGNAAINRNQASIYSYLGAWNHGRHNIQFGGDFRWQQFNTYSQQSPRGTFTFTGALTQQPAAASGTPAGGYDFADFLLGVPDQSQIAFGNADKYFRSVSPDLFIVDDWKVTPGFSLSLTARWDYSSPITELYGRLVNLDIAPGFAAAAPVVANSPTGSITNTTYPASLMRPDKREVTPKIGLAWRPFPASSMVVRAGYGISYNTNPYMGFANNMAQQSPLSKSLNVLNSAANPLTLANGFYSPANVLTNTFAVDPNFQIGYAQVWNASVQRDLPASLVMLATYTGTKGTHQAQSFVPNTYPTGVVSPCPSCPSGFTYYTSGANSEREAGSMQLRRRLHNGFTASVLYTYSKSIDDASAVGSSMGSTAQNWLDLRAERGPSSFDQRHLANIQLQYTTGMGVGGGALMTGWRGKIIKGWTFVDTVDVGSGLPLNPVYSQIIGAVSVPIRPSYTGQDLYAASNGLFLNPQALTAPAYGEWGNAGKNSMRGPAQFDMTASMQRNFKLSDRLNLSLNIQATNPLNHVVYTSYGTVITSPQFGLPTAANAMRNITTFMRLTF
ncbi:MAG TPA: carboxypeptidase-like regulatory domain-containing protein [Bryobacteraceae bacterium]|nr:carboxypeptidase-like regulatory domain-containing protein [Bryobacteraceae bacterium]